MALVGVAVSSCSLLLSSSIGEEVRAAGDPVLVGAGDIAKCGHQGDEATAKLLDNMRGMVITLGDNVYQDGTATEFLHCYGSSWGRHKDRTRPAAGNHEYNTPGASGYYGYFGARAGDPSKGYYSYNKGSWHIVVLNSNCWEVSCAKGSAQEQWLKSDLDANSSKCTLAYFHYPRPRKRHKGVCCKHLRCEHHSFETIKPNSQVRNATPYGVLKLILHASSYEWKFVPVAGKTFTDSGIKRCH